MPASGETSIYRLYNPNNGDHFYTSNKREYRGNEIFTSHNGYYYFLKLENPITTKCNVANASRGTTQTETSKYMQLSGQSYLQSFVGLRVMVTGKMGAYGTGTSNRLTVTRP